VIVNHVNGFFGAPEGRSAGAEGAAGRRSAGTDNKLLLAEFHCRV